MNPIEVSGLSKSFDDFVAVDRLSFTVNPGDIYGFLGPNGAGKSTTIRMLLGLIRPSAGSIRFFGQEVKVGEVQYLKRIGAIVEKPDFYKYLSARNNLKIFGTMSDADTSSKNIDRVIELVGLAGRDKDPVKNYSHGMKQRLGLAQALLHDPELVILDEPTTGLDPQGIVDLRNLTLQLRSLGKTVFMSSHILSEVELIATRMVIISKGRAVAEGSVQELLDADDLLVRFSFNDIRKAQEVIDQSVWKSFLTEGDHHDLIFRLRSQEVESLNAWLCETGCAPVGINSKRKLEDFFMKLTR